jgi:hypothetical protein
MGINCGWKLTHIRGFCNCSIHVILSLQNRWKNAMVLLKQMNCLVTHICREGNQVANSLANFGLALSEIAFWNEAHLFIIDRFKKNQLDLSSFRVCTS